MLEYLLEIGIDENTITYVNPVESSLEKEYIKMGFTNVIRRPLEYGSLEGTLRSNINAISTIDSPYIIRLVDHIIS
jgi:hypothetical protein